MHLTPLKFDLVVYGSHYASRWYKMIAGTQEIQTAEFSFEPPSHEGFWSPICKSLTLNLLGYLPTFASLTDRRVLSPPSDKSRLPVVTYIDRQKNGRRLTEESHKSLVDALLELKAEGVCELQIVRMQDVSIREQVRLAARSAVSFVLSSRHLIRPVFSSDERPPSNDPEVARCRAIGLASS